jgi:hypothetical protein
MQTFITSGDWFKIATVLDNKRLNKQALEGWQIMLNLLELDPHGNDRKPRGWTNHPAVKMWRGSEAVLHAYVQNMVYEWKRRGFNSTIGDKALATARRATKLGRMDMMHIKLPVWWQDRELFEKIASSHRTALLSKNYDWYSQFGWAEDTGVAPAAYEYVWGTADV